MKLYLAGLYASNFDVNGRIFNRLTEPEKWHRWEVKHFLESHHYIHRPRYVEKIKKDNTKVFLDSGAFSAFTKGIEVDIKAYCRYIQDNMEIIETTENSVCASVLDGIGDPQLTYENQMTMQGLGVTPLPCFHYGEDERYLDYYVENYDYITIGGMVPISTPQLKLWLDRLWEDHLTHADGTPKIKVHGFGLTSLPLMMRYPWYSVDSSTWVQWAANGMILEPGVGQINISDRSSSRKIENQHIDNIAAVQREAIEKKIESFGFDPERLATEYISRWVYNAWAFPYYAKDKYFENDKFIPDTMRLF